MSELSEQAPSKLIAHKKLDFKQFRPMNLAPQGFTSMGMVDKMKEFVLQFSQSEDVTKDVKSTEHIKKWLQGFKLENMPREAVDELWEMVGVAEDKNKIALIDLVRLVLLQEHSAAHVLHKHWQDIELNIFGYMQCMDIKDADAKVLQNYHLISLKMLGNIYQTESGKEFMQGEEASSSLINFCVFSFDACNPKVVFTAAVLLFNHVLCFKRDKAVINKDLIEAVLKINAVIVSPELSDAEALQALLLSECRILYNNRQLCEYTVDKIESEFRKNHFVLKNKTQHAKVKECVDDVLSLVFKD